MQNKMKTILIFTLFIFIHIQGCFSMNINGLYEDTEKKLLNFTKQINYRISSARLSQSLSQTLFDEQERAKLDNSKLKIEETASKYIKNYKDWIEKAKKLNVDPGNCTKDWLQIEIFIPRGAYPNITDSFGTESGPLLREWVYLFQNLTSHIPEVVKELQNGFYNCNKSDENCLRNISKAIDDNLVLFNQIQEIIVKIKNILEKILEVLDICIDRSIQSLDSKEKELTDKGINCIKELLK